MNKTLIPLVGLALGVGLAACTTPRDATELSQKTVHYTCGPQGAHQPLTVQYTIQGNYTLAPNVLDNTQAGDPTRPTSAYADMVDNTLRDYDYAGTTDK